MWKENLNAKRDEFYRSQLKVAVRQDPDTARSALEYRPRGVDSPLPGQG